jgi:hypothetical protein
MLSEACNGSDCGHQNGGPRFGIVREPSRAINFQKLYQGDKYIVSDSSFGLRNLLPADFPRLKIIHLIFRHAVILQHA